MKPLPLIPFLIAIAGCADIPELEGSESRALRKAPYPALLALDATLGAPVDPVSEAAEIKDELTARSDALAKRAETLQNAEIN